MDNIKMGTFIREIRKEKGLTQKNIASQLNITDRAVSKWERGICAPDLALIESLADILGVTITELITGERQIDASNKAELEHAVKETINYSKQEISKKKKTNLKRILICLIAVILGISIVLGILWYNGFFHIIGRYPSPDGTTVTTVYDCDLGYHEPPTSGGFTLSDEGYFRRCTTYKDAEFKGLWWSPNGSYQVVSFYRDNEYIDDELELWLTDYSRNCSVNLTSSLEDVLYENEFFSQVPFNAYGGRDIFFDFVQWSNIDPEIMLIYFTYIDAEEVFHEGYMWYDYESGLSSGEMEIEQGEKETYWLHEVFDWLY